MSRTERKIANIQDQIKNKKDDLEKLIKKYNREKREQQDVYFTIRCIPSKSDHCTHTTGIFSTYDLAFKCLPECGYSHDSDDNCTWNYSIECVKSSDVSNYYNELDKCPDHFPYYGW